MELYDEVLKTEKLIAEVESAISQLTWRVEKRNFPVNFCGCDFDKDVKWCRKGL